LARICRRCRVSLSLFGGDLLSFAHASSVFKLREDFADDLLAVIQAREDFDSITNLLSRCDQTHARSAGSVDDKHADELAVLSDRLPRNGQNVARAANESGFTVKTGTQLLRGDVWQTQFDGIAAAVGIGRGNDLDD